MSFVGNKHLIIKHSLMMSSLKTSILTMQDYHNAEIIQCFNLITLQVILQEHIIFIIQYVIIVHYLLWPDLHHHVMIIWVGQEAVVEFLALERTTI